MNPRYVAGFVVGFVSVVGPIAILTTFAYKVGKVHGRAEAWNRIKADLQVELDRIDSTKK